MRACADNRCILEISAGEVLPPCYTRSLQWRHGEEPPTLGPLELSLAGRVSKEDVPETTRGLTVREKAQCESRCAPDPPERVASLSTALLLTNLQALGWPTGWLSKHDTQENSMGWEGWRQARRKRDEKSKTRRRKKRRKMHYVFIRD